LELSCRPICTDCTTAAIHAKFANSPPTAVRDQIRQFEIRHERKKSASDKVL
jgi:hypothetical protein